jgi:hypothetical protein
MVFKNGLIAVLFILHLPGFPDGLPQVENYSATITQTLLLKDIPSASGMATRDHGIFVVGDDSPYLFQLDTAFNLIQHFKIYDASDHENGRIPKALKPDFESMVSAPWGKDEDLLIFGSGSVPEIREIMVRIDFDQDKQEIRTYSLEKLYHHISKNTLEKGNLNIEGAAYWNNNLILLNRGDNTLFMIDYDGFVEHMKDGKKKLPDVVTFKYELPILNGITARFSGAALLPDEDVLVFTATVENTPDWINDGEILGSYLGLIDLEQLNNTTPVCVPIIHENQHFQGKVEGIMVSHISESHIELIGVTDNDNGFSRLLQMELRKNNR